MNDYDWKEVEVLAENEDVAIAMEVCSPRGVPPRYRWKLRSPDREVEYRSGEPTLHYQEAIEGGRREGEWVGLL